MILWIFGNSGAGKTTLANQLKDHLKFIHLDGDDLRQVWRLGFSRQDRFEQNLRAARLAQIFQQQGHRVVVSLICPYNELRQQVTAICQPTWLYLPGGHVADDRYPFEAPNHPVITLQPIPGQNNISTILKTTQELVL